MYKPLPLVIDLDGTLINSDLLIESALGFVGNQPLKFYRPLKWLKSCKANLKSQLAQVVDIDFCLRLKKDGHKNIWTPVAELYYRELATRGYEDSPERRHDLC